MYITVSEEQANTPTPDEMQMDFTPPNPIIPTETTIPQTTTTQTTINSTQTATSAPTPPHTSNNAHTTICCNQRFH